MQPKVSIIIPTYNRAHLLGETLESVLAQTYENWECIVVDDGSTDHTDELLEFYDKKDSRIQFYHRPSHKSKGANACRNYGFEVSKGEYIQWLDSDDILNKDKVGSQVKALEKNSSFGIATCKFGYIDQHLGKSSSIRENVKTYNNFQKGYDLLEYFGRYSEYFPPHVYLVKRSCVVEVGLWDESLSINQDGEFLTRILLGSWPIIFVEAAVLYRINMNENVSQVNSLEKAKDLVKSWKLINGHFGRKNVTKKSSYIERGKKQVYRKIKKHYPEVVVDNFSFLRSAMPFHKRFFRFL